MSTRSYIGRKNPETNTYDYIYCQFDGYIEGVGDTLDKYYRDDNKIKELLTIGPLSSLHERISPLDPTNHGCGYDYDEDQGKMIYRPREQGTTVSFPRDRRHEDDEYIVHHADTIDEIIQQGNADWVVFIYLWEDNDWKVYSEYTPDWEYNYVNENGILLTDALKKAAEADK